MAETNGIAITPPKALPRVSIGGVSYELKSSLGVAMYMEKLGVDVGNPIKWYADETKAGRILSATMTLLAAFLSRHFSQVPLVELPYYLAELAGGDEAFKPLCEAVQEAIGWAALVERAKNAKAEAARILASAEEKPNNPEVPTQKPN